MVSDKVVPIWFISLLDVFLYKVVWDSEFSIKESFWMFVSWLLRVIVYLWNKSILENGLLVWLRKSLYVKLLNEWEISDWPGLGPHIPIPLLNFCVYFILSLFVSSNFKSLFDFHLFYRINKSVPCMRLLPLQGLGSVGCTQPFPYMQRGCFCILNLWCPGQHGAALALLQACTHLLILSIFC